MPDQARSFDGWPERKLHEIAEIRTGIAKNSSADVADPVDVHYLRVANVQDGYLDLREMKTLRVNRADLNRYSVRPGDVLMNEGGDLDKLGRGAIWTGRYNPCVHQNHVFVVRCGSQVLPEFLNAWTAGSAARRYFLLAGRQTTNLASINKTSLGNLPVALPPLAEQEAIAKALGDTDALIESLEQFIAKKRLIKQGVMQELLTGKRRLPGFSRPWIECQLGRIADIRSGGTPSTTVRGNWDGEIPWCTPTDITALRGGKFLARTVRTITKLGLRSSSAELIPAKSVVMTSRATIGECAINTVPITTNQGFKNLVPIAGTDHEFLFYLMQTQKQNLIALCAGSTFLEIGKRQLDAFALSIPAEQDEQSAIADVLSAMDRELEAEKLRLEKAQGLKQAMMSELLTGRIRLV